MEVQAGGALKVYVREAPADGKANRKLIELVADHYGVPKSFVKIIHGETSRQKTVEVQDVKSK